MTEDADCQEKINKTFSCLITDFLKAPPGVLLAIALQSSALNKAHRTKTLKPFDLQHLLSLLRLLEKICYSFLFMVIVALRVGISHCVQSKVHVLPSQPWEPQLAACPQSWISELIAGVWDIRGHTKQKFHCIWAWVYVCERWACIASLTAYVDKKEPLKTGEPSFCSLIFQMCCNW